MTQEEKQLLLKDLCARLPYGVNVLDDMGRTYKLQLGNAYLIDLFYGNGDYVEAPIRPYLRPMSNMTEEENEYRKELIKDIKYGANIDKLEDFYHSRNLDYRGLIEKGLALEAPKNMYNF